MQPGRGFEADIAQNGKENSFTSVKQLVLSRYVGGAVRFSGVLALPIGGERL